MRTINLKLDDQSHKILKVYQAENGYPNQEKALNALIKAYNEMK